jgi:hypothetical protein
MTPDSNRPSSGPMPSRRANGITTALMPSRRVIANRRSGSLRMVFNALPSAAFSLSTPLHRRLPLCNSVCRENNVGSPGRTRTCDQPVNSRLLYQLSYRGTRVQREESAL